MANISMRQLASYAVNQLETGMPQNEVSKRLASYLVEERLSGSAHTLGRLIEAEFAKRGTTYVTISSVRKVDEAVKKQLASALGVNNPKYQEKIDDNLIGGVRASTLEKELDLTVSRQLKAVIKNIKGAK